MVSKWQVAVQFYPYESHAKNQSKDPTNMIHCTLQSKEVDIVVK